MGVDIDRVSGAANSGQDVLGGISAKVMQQIQQSQEALAGSLVTMMNQNTQQMAASNRLKSPGLGENVDILV
jgi:hypothetical protein